MVAQRRTKPTTISIPTRRSPRHPHSLKTPNAEKSQRRLQGGVYDPLTMDRQPPKVKQRSENEPFFDLLEFLFLPFVGLGEGFPSSSWGIFKDFSLFWWDLGPCRFQPLRIWHPDVTSAAGTKRGRFSYYGACRSCMTFSALDPSPCRIIVHSPLPDLKFTRFNWVTFSGQW